MVLKLIPGDVWQPWNAELQLEWLDCHEDVGEFYDQETIPLFREQFIKSYRKLVGIHPADRHAYRQALQHIRDEEGNASVALVIEQLNRERQGIDPDWQIE